MNVWEECSSGKEEGREGGREEGREVHIVHVGKLNSVIGKLWGRGRGSEEGTEGSRKYRRHPKVGTALPTHGHTCDWYNTQTNASRNTHV